jgi:hypothetical protein
MNWYLTAYILGAFATAAILPRFSRGEPAILRQKNPVAIAGACLLWPLGLAIICVMLPFVIVFQLCGGEIDE